MLDQIRLVRHGKGIKFLKKDNNHFIIRIGDHVQRLAAKASRSPLPLSLDHLEANLYPDLLGHYAGQASDNSNPPMEGQFDPNNAQNLTEVRALTMALL